LRGDSHDRTTVVQNIKDHPVVVFMKSAPAQPQCWFSASVVELLRHDDAPANAVDVVADPVIRQAIKTYSDGPTIPRLVDLRPFRETF
jgi:monothiol glutaredoxin